MSCFILTKWYVNIFKNVGDTLKSMGFILTKWYVNETYKPTADSGSVVLY
ncbi:hypothetical protein QGW_3058 [Clostridioides difficile 824]|nr:hypothetical protein QCI_2925 [Clostridioides difficile CD44]EQF87555.1 hypothetical protein QGW_3058 [Clostridioides difficile 824]